MKAKRFFYVKGIDGAYVELDDGRHANSVDGSHRSKLAVARLVLDAHFNDFEQVDTPVVSDWPASHFHAHVGRRIDTADLERIANTMYSDKPTTLDVDGLTEGQLRRILGDAVVRRESAWWIEPLCYDLHSKYPTLVGHIVDRALEVTA
jgi:hypothetical protein